MVKTSSNYLLQISIVFSYYYFSSHLAFAANAPEWPYESTSITLAYLNFTFTEIREDLPNVKTSSSETAQFSFGAAGSAHGIIVLGVKTSSESTIASSGKSINSVDLKSAAAAAAEDGNYGCVLQWSPPKNIPWVALLPMELCGNPNDFRSATAQNASAIIVYDATKRIGYRSSVLPGE